MQPAACLSKSSCNGTELGPLLECARHSDGCKAEISTLWPFTEKSADPALSKLHSLPFPNPLGCQSLADLAAKLPNAKANKRWGGKKKSVQKRN